MVVRVLHVIPALERGGAEHVLCRVIENGPQDFEHLVICLRNKGPLAQRLEKHGVAVRTVELNTTLNLPGSFLRLVRLIREAKPDLIQTWMYHSDLMGGLAAKLSGSPPLIWSIRQSNFPPNGMRLFTKMAAYLSARLSGWLPDLIAANSEAGRNFHAELGYKADKMVVILNGIDLKIFKPDRDAKKQIRAELKLANSTQLVGLFGRFHPQKDHETFIRAAARLAKQQKNVHFLLGGRNVDKDNKKLERWIKQAELTDKIHLLGERSDMPRLQAALDLAVSSSAFAEGMSNTILEAMACAVPCVVTDIGDNPRLVETRFVVPPENPTRLAEAMQKIMQMPEDKRNKIGQKNRETIEENYSLTKMVSKFHTLYNSLADSNVTYHDNPV